jgi:hypothetical protein
VRSVYHVLCCPTKEEPVRFARVVLTIAVVAGLVAGSVAVGPPASVLALGTVISPNNSDSNQYAALSKNPVNGWLTAIWFADTGVQEFKVRSSTSTDGGASWSSEITVYTAASGADSWGIRLAYDSSGGLHAFFGFGEGSGRRVRYSYVAAGADPRSVSNWQGGGTDLCAAGACLYPDVAVDGSGYVYLLYEDTDNQLHIRRRQGTSSSWSDAKIISPGDRVRGSIAVGPDGKLHVAYLKVSDRNAWYERYTSFDNFTQEAKTQISSGDVNDFPDVVVGSNNVVHLTWPQDGEAWYRSVTGGTLSSARSISSSFNGRANLSIAVSGTNTVYVTYNRDNFKALWQSSSADWDNPTKLAGSDPTARYQRYAVTHDGEVSMVLVEGGKVRYYRSEAAVTDNTAPAISGASLSTSSTSSQRITASVTATDPTVSGESTTGVKTYEYSLDGTNYATGLTISPAAAPGAQTVPIDLANPAAGGSWNSGSLTVRLRVKDAAGNASAVTSLSVTFTPGTITTRYLAEGYTGGTFDEYVTLANTTGATIYVSLTFQYAGSSTGIAGTVVEIPANQRRTVTVDSAAGTGKELSIKLESNAAFYAERPMYFTNYPAAAGVAYNRRGISALSGINGGHLGVAATAPQPDWYFAEGYTGDGFEAYFTIQNPQTATSNVTIRYYYANGTTEDKSFQVGAGQRKTIVVHAPSGEGAIGPDKTFSAKVSTTNGRDIIVERVQYFRYTGSMGAVTGGTATLGATSPGTTWYFAEGYTGSGFDEYLTIQNPNATAGTATITYYIEGNNTPATCSVPLAANSRTTVVVHNETSTTDPCGLGRGKAHATKVQTTVATVVERPMYFLYQGGTASTASIDGGHNVMGATSLIGVGQSVVLAEGYTGSGFHEYLTFQNPNSADVSVTISYLKADGSAPVSKSLTIPANQRKTVAVHNGSDPAGLGTGQEFSVRITVNSGGAVLAERVMYFRYAGSATGGTSAFGAP